MSRSGGSSLRRAHRSLWVLIAISILAAGWLSAAVSSPPGPMTGLSFALSAMLLLAAMMLAARVVIALERARRATRPPMPPLATDFPVMTRLLSFRRRAGRAGHEPDGRRTRGRSRTAARSAAPVAIPALIARESANPCRNAAW